MGSTIYSSVLSVQLARGSPSIYFIKARSVIAYPTRKFDINYGLPSFEDLNPDRDFSRKVAFAFIAAVFPLLNGMRA